MNFTYAIYTHSEFSDILQIFYDYVKSYDFVFIADKPVENNLKKPTFVYDGNKPYAHRLLTALSQLQSDYVLLIHDNDIPLHQDVGVLNKLVDFMSLKNIDRIDLQVTLKNGGDFYKILPDQEVSNWPKLTNFQVGEGIYLNEHQHTYRYNVNPSIWKRDSFLKLLNAFPNKSYREIECYEVENFIRNYKIYNLFTYNPLQCGFFKCADFFKFLHITHGGYLLKNSPEKVSSYGQSYIDAAKEYKEIIDRYNLKSGKRPFA